MSTSGITSSMFSQLQQFQQDFNATRPGSAVRQSFCGAIRFCDATERSAAKPVPRLLHVSPLQRYRIAARLPRPSVNSRKIFSPEISRLPSRTIRPFSRTSKARLRKCTTTIITLGRRSGESSFPTVRSVGSGFTIWQSVECPVGLQFVAAAFAEQHRLEPSVREHIHGRVGHRLTGKAIRGCDVC